MKIAAPYANLDLTISIEFSRYHKFIFVEAILYIIKFLNNFQVLSKNKSANSKQKKTRVRIKKKSQGDDPDFQYVTGDRDNFITHLSLYISSIVGRARRESALFRDNVGSSANNPIEIEEQHSSRLICQL